MVRNKDLTPNLAANSGSLLLQNFFDRKYLPFAKATKRRSDLDEYTFGKHIKETFGHRELTSITSEEVVPLLGMRVWA